MIPHALLGLLWEVLPFLSLGPLGIGIMLLRHFSHLPLKALLTIGAAGVVLIFGMAYNRQRGQIAFLETEQVRMLDAIQTQEDSIAIQRQTIVSWQERYIELQNTLEEQERIAAVSQAAKERLLETFRNENLTDLSRTQPEVVEQALSARTLDAMRSLRCLSEASGNCND
jgi:hypothetical protein